MQLDSEYKFEVCSFYINSQNICYISIYNIFIIQYRVKNEDFLNLEIFINIINDNYN